MPTTAFRWSADMAQIKIEAPQPAAVPAAVPPGMWEKPLKFGSVFTPHMVTAKWSEGAGWHEFALVPTTPINLHPASLMLHYGQQIFEGLKAYRHAGDQVALFRPGMNAARFNRSAVRLAMPILPEEMFVEGLEALVRMDRAWIPVSEQGSLYLRPFMFAEEPSFEVRAATSFRYLALASPVGDYFSNPDGLTIWVSEHFTRAAHGGTGAAKCAGNYAASLSAQHEARANGCVQALFLDAKEGRWIEELGGMNFFAVTADQGLVTPPLGGTILGGVTRDSILQIAPSVGLRATERMLALDELLTGLVSGEIVEMFATGTAAVVAPIAALKTSKGIFGPAERVSGTAAQLRSMLGDIQRGNAPDPFDWVHLI